MKRFLNITTKVLLVSAFSIPCYGEHDRGEVSLEMQYPCLAFNDDASKEKLIARAKRGDARAQEALAKMLFFGIGTAPDYEASVKWRTKAAEQKFPEAQYQLAGMYLYGYGVQKNFGKAVALLEDAAANGCTPAAVLLGQLYERPPADKPQNLCEAAKWYQTATDHGDPLAYFMLKALLRHGGGIDCPQE